MKHFRFTDLAKDNWLLCGPGGWSFGSVSYDENYEEAFVVAGTANARSFQALQANEGMHLFIVEEIPFVEFAEEIPFVEEVKIRERATVAFDKVMDEGGNIGQAIDACNAVCAEAGIPGMQIVDDKPEARHNSN